MKGVAVLMYHALETMGEPAGAVDPGERRYVLEADRFGEQLAYLHRHGFTTLLLEELDRAGTWPERAVVLTFDDGHMSNVTLALPLLERYGFRAEFFITTDWIGKPRFMEAKQIRALSEAGMGIGSHGASHRFLDEMDVDGVARELKVSKEILAEITGRDVVSFSAPGGRMTPRGSAVARGLGYRFLCTSHPGLLASDEQDEIPRLPLRERTDIRTFGLLVHGSRKHLGKLKARERALALFRRVLGNRYYGAVTKALLRYAR